MRALTPVTVSRRGFGDRRKLLESSNTLVDPVTSSQHECRTKTKTRWKAVSHLLSFRFPFVQKSGKGVKSLVCDVTYCA